MTDPAATAANDLAITAPAQSSPAAPVTADMPFDDALLAKNQRIADPAWRNKYMAVDVGCKAEMDALVQALTPKQPMPSHKHGRRRDESLH
jgi:hypothetical protein